MDTESGRQAALAAAFYVLSMYVPVRFRTVGANMTSGCSRAVSSIGQRNTYLDMRVWSDDDEARISQDEGFGG